AFASGAGHRDSGYGAKTITGQPAACVMPKNSSHVSTVAADRPALPRAIPRSVRRTTGVSGAGGSYGVLHVERAPGPQPSVGQPSKYRTRVRSRPTTSSS